MSVSCVGPSVIATQAAAAQSKAIDPPNDGDNDDAAAAPVQSAPAPGTGQQIDIKA